MRIGFDADGVLYDFAESLKQFLVSRGFPAARCTPPLTWKFYMEWGLTLEQFIEACNEGIRAGVVLTYGEPYEGAREAMTRIVDAGHTIHIVTARDFGPPGASESSTSKWLTNSDLPFHSLTFSSDKTLVRTDFMIEDKLENYDALIDSGCNAWLMDRPWNQANDKPRKRVYSLNEFADKVLDNAA
jgi:hypothetical protein